MSKPGRSTESEIIAATLVRDHEALRVALNRGIDPNEVDRDGRTALHHAAINGDEGAVTVLLEAGAAVDARDHAGWTPLHFAASGYHVLVAKMLLEADANVESVDSHGNTPLLRAVFESRGRGEMIGVLRAHGADIYHMNQHGVSPVALASTIANYDVAQWLK